MMKKKRLLKLKGCPRCAGDLLAEDDELICLQCGHSVRLADVPATQPALPSSSAA